MSTTPRIPRQPPFLVLTFLLCLAEVDNLQCWAWRFPDTPRSCLIRPSNNCLIHFYKRCVPQPWLVQAGFLQDPRRSFYQQLLNVLKSWSWHYCPLSSPKHLQQNVTVAWATSMQTVNSQTDNLSTRAPTKVRLLARLGGSLPRKAACRQIEYVSGSATQTRKSLVKGERFIRSVWMAEMIGWCVRGGTRPYQPT